MWLFLLWSFSFFLGFIGDNCQRLSNIGQIDGFTWCGVSIVDSCRLRFVVAFSNIGDTELNTVSNDTYRVQNLPDDVDGLVADIGQEHNGYQSQHNHQSRGTNDIFQPLHHINTVVSARIVNLVAHDGSKELGKQHRAPHHDDDQREEPF